MVVAVIVTYNPDYSLLEQNISSLSKQVDRIIIVKNSGEEFDNRICNSLVEKIQLKTNFGIAYAQNRGIEKAIDFGANFVLFSDQDTIFPDDYIKKCIEIYENNKSSYKIAAVVPLFFNENKQELSRVMITKTKAISPETNKIYSLAHAISSGSFIPVSVLKVIGFMNERMFIDYVDNEWCWRATREGFSIICDTGLVISHSMGDNYKKVLGRKFVVYSNFRNYFFIRNSYYLLFHSHLLSFSEFFSFFLYTKIKSILFFITKGVTVKNIMLYFNAKFKGITNMFTLEEEIK